MSIDLSLDRLRELVRHLPPYTRPTLHIAGTNGKGSVSALLTSILLASSPPLRVGRFNSPHLVSIYDSITLDNLPVSPNVYDTATEEVQSKDREHGTKLSSFEILTITALQIFESSKVDVVVLEVGMGGRLDATNIVPSPTIAVSALTAVALDHQFFLGNTVSEIAQEKAGIARPGRPFVLGRQEGQDVEGVLRAVLRSIGSEGMLVRAPGVVLREWDADKDGPVPAPPFILSFERPPPQPVSVTLPCFPNTPIDALLPLYGAHQLDNLGTALGVISALLTHPPPSSLKLSEEELSARITPSTIKEGIRNVRWPGRLSFHTVPVPISSGSQTEEKERLVVLADGAHNPASAGTLGRYVTHLIGLALASAAVGDDIELRLTYILALSHSPPKTPLQTLGPILPPHLPSESLPTSASSDVHINMKTSVAIVSFSPPEGMPWVKPVPEPDLEQTVRELVRGADVEVFGGVHADGVNEGLEKALRWAAAKQRSDEDREEGKGKKKLSLVVLAGSLYLVADFYRLLEREGVVERKAVVG